MKTLRNFKYRIYTSGSKLKKLNSTLDGCRLLYNRILDTRKTAWESEKKKISNFDCIKLITTLKIENIHSQVLQNVSQRVDLAFQGFFRRVKQNKGEKCGLEISRDHNAAKNILRFGMESLSESRKTFALEAQSL